MDSKPIGEAETGQRLGATPAEIARNGWFVMLPGDVYNAMFELTEKLLRDGDPDPSGRQFLEQLQLAMVQSAKPYKTKNKIQIASHLPGLP